MMCPPRELPAERRAERGRRTRPPRSWPTPRVGTGTGRAGTRPACLAPSIRAGTSRPKQQDRAREHVRRQRSEVAVVDESHEHHGDEPRHDEQQLTCSVRLSRAGRDWRSAGASPRTPQSSRSMRWPPLRRSGHGRRDASYGKTTRGHGAGPKASVDAPTHDLAARTRRRVRQWRRRCAGRRARRWNHRSRLPRARRPRPTAGSKVGPTAANNAVSCLVRT